MQLFPKRRRLRFSVRTLLVAVTIFCVWLGWQVSIVRERKLLVALVNAQQERQNNSIESGRYHLEPIKYRVPLIRRLLGDETYPKIALERGKIDSTIFKRVNAAFPESQILLWNSRFALRHRKALIPDAQTPPPKRRAPLP